jgi:GT2 family glycosyltransferase
VVFIDDDVVPTPALIAEHIRIHAEQAADVVVLGPMLSPPDFLMSPWVRWEQAMLMKQYDAMVAGRWRPSPRQFYTGNASLKRQRLIAAGGFNEAFRRAEDVELAYRLAEHGLSFVFNPQAIGYHYAERSFRSWLDIPYAYGRNDVIFWRDKHQDWLLPQINREFHRRNTLIRVLVHLCVGRARRTASALAVLTFAVHMSARLRIWRAAHLLYSSIFNVRYYQGLADELGGRASFLAHVS